ncbi:MAG: MFS transporter [Lachnospiraceae bacterium]|nr:MFS transporter [Lachnospiraceae bacterium]
MKKKNVWLNGILPMFLINFSIGAVYCWTLFKEYVNAFTDFAPWVTEWCFSLAIFFLGMSAAFGGNIVEKNPKKSAFLTFIFFTAGWLLTGFGVMIKNPWIMVLGFGVVQGIGLGLGYITPVKTMMIWMDGRKGLAAGLSIASFGIAGVIANPIIGALLESGMLVYNVFFILTAIYAVALFAASRLLYRPAFEEPEGTIIYKPKEIIFHGKFIFLWLIIFLNITCGLAVISQEKQIYNMIGVPLFGAGMAMVVVFCSINAISNVFGRLSLATWQDKLKEKHVPYYLMAGCSLFVSFALGIVYFLYRVPKPTEHIMTTPEGVPFSMNLSIAEGEWILPLLVLTVIFIFVVQFFFGVGFGCLPNVLHQNYGISQLSTVHGLVLSAWGFAGLVGNQLSSFIIRNFDLNTLYMTLGGLYTLMLVFLLVWVRVRKKQVTVA